MEWPNLAFAGHAAGPRAALSLMLASSAGLLRVRATG